MSCSLDYDWPMVTTGEFGLVGNPLMTHDFTLRA